MQGTLFDNKADKINKDGTVKGAEVIYAPVGQAGEYAKLAANPYRGCGHQCVYCVAPDTLVQMADGQSIPIDGIEIGDEIMGARPGPHHGWLYAPALVLNKIDTHKEAYKITLENGGTLICSGDHRWLATEYHRKYQWEFTRNLREGTQILTTGASVETPAPTLDYKRGYLSGIIKGDGLLRRYDYSGKYQRHTKRAPQKTDIQHQFRLAMNDVEALDRTTKYLSDFGISVHRFTFKHDTEMPAIRNNSKATYEDIDALIQRSGGQEWSRGWLAGFFDAEGSGGSGSGLNVSNTDGDLLTTTEQCGGYYNFKMSRSKATSKGCYRLYLKGGTPETVRFFNLTNPSIKRKFTIAGRLIGKAAKVVSVEKLQAKMRMIDISTSTENFFGNSCLAHNCYVPRIIKISRQEFDSGAVPKPGFLERIKKDAAKYQAAGITEQVMLSFTTDPYPPLFHQLTREILIELKNHGMGFCTLTKGGFRALRDLDLFRPERDAFASTLTTLSDKQSKEWEGGAALPGERLKTLQTFHEHGIFTWVSLEPVYDTAMTIALIKETADFVDLYKIGRINYHRITQQTDWRKFTEQVLEVVTELKKKHYIKKDLACFLPPNYYNPLRVDQHR